MFVLGHAGISVGAVAAVDRRADLRWVPFFALLPDLLDKPICALLPGFANGWSRTLGHSLVGLAVFTVVSAAVARKRAWLAVVPYALHFVLDRMWREVDRPVLLWPFLGSLPPHDPPYAHWWDRFEEPWQLGGELVGLAALAFLVARARLWEPGSWARFRSTGVLLPDVARAAEAR